MKAQAFTLVEMMVAVVLASIVAAAATTATVAIYRSTVAMEQSSYANEEGKVVIDSLITSVLQVGGGRVRPWSAVSNGCFVNASGTVTAVDGANCTGNGGTRLDFLDLEPKAKQLTLSTAAGTVTATSAEVALIGGVCPLTPANGYPAGGVDVVVLPVEPAGGGWLARRCTPNVTTCTCALAALTGASVDVSAASTRTLTGGLLVVGRAVSYSLDTATHTLIERRDIDGDGSVESRIVSDRVFDLRVQLGYDAAPEDGVMDGTWLTSLDTRSSALTTVPPQTLRMARIGVVVGARVTNQASKSPSASLFGNTPVMAPGFYLKNAESAVTMRNLLVFF
jgi:prepilin-type N-terminal cleavage/methylation domain-containing protein